VTNMLRVEEWTKEFHPDETEDEEHRAAPFINTLVVSIWEGEKVDGEAVHVQQEMTAEFGLDTEKAEEIVPEFQHRFVWEFPYDVVKTALEERDWVKNASPS
jgi:hypothetical protein